MHMGLAGSATFCTRTENCIVFAFCAQCAVGACAWSELQSRQCTDNTDAHVQTARKHPVAKTVQLSVQHTRYSTCIAHAQTR